MLFLAILLGLLVVCILIFLIDSAFGGLDFTTRRSVVAKVVEIIKRAGLDHGNIYDLGSARGGFAIKIARALPKAHVYGIDNSKFRIWFSKVRGVFTANASFAYGDVFEVNISDADVVYVYLPKELMPDVQEKIQHQLKPGSLVVTNRVSFPTWETSQVWETGKSSLDKVFIYKFA